MEMFKVNLVHLSVFMIAFCVGLVKRVQTDKFTSMVDIKSLLSTEKEFKTFIDSYIIAEEERLQIIEEYLIEMGESSFSNLSDVVISNPLNAFRVMTELLEKEKLLNHLMENTSMAELLSNYTMAGKHVSFPDYFDLQGVAVALDRLVTTYNLNITSVSNGQLYPGANKAKKFSGDDCFEVGFHLYASKKFAKSIPWFVEALSRELKEMNIINKTFILEFLANSTYLASMDYRNSLALYNFNNITMEIREKLKMQDREKKENNFEIFQKWFDDIKIFMENENVKIGDVSYEEMDEKAQRNNELCRQEQSKNVKKESKLKCYYSRKNSKYLTIQPIKIEDMYIKPSILIYHDILSDREIETIKNLSKPGLARAEVGSGGTADYRTSQSSWLDDYDHNVVKRISKRLQEITSLEVMKASELLQVVNYGIGGHYDTHYDFDHALEKGTSDKDNPLGNRIATVLIYLSDVKAGGSTTFPNLNIAVRPHKGSAIFWYNLYKSGDGDYDTEHAACPVLMGSKWVANKWILENHQEFFKPCGLSEDDYYYY